MMNNKAALAAFFVFGAAGCGSIHYATIPATCPPVPILPLVLESELQALTDDAYRRLVERELRLREHIGQLRSFCYDGLPQP